MPAEMKASYMQDDVRALARLPQGAAARVRARATAEIAIIEAAMRSAWLPMPVDIRLTEAIFAEVGEAGVQLHSKEALKASLSGPLLRPFRDAAIKLFGVRTHAVLGVVPRAWGQIFRGVGELSARELEPRRASVVLAGACDEVLGSVAWCAGTAGTFEGIAETAGVAAKATVSVDAAARTVTWDVSW